LTTEHPFDLTGKRSFVTGAGSGIGRQAAIRLAGAGAEVICADRDGAAASATANGIVDSGGSATSVAVDVADQEQVAGALSGPAVHILCNVAGILTHAAATDLTEAELDRVLAVNLKGTLFCAQSAFEGMRGAGGGSIINLASAAIDSIGANLVAYAVSKAAIAQLTRSLATEWARSGIRVNAIAPGFVDTPMTSHSYRDAEGGIDTQKRSDYLERMRDFTPLGIAGEADDIANCIWFLASDASRYMTGQILRPNGGIAMPW